VRGNGVVQLNPKERNEHVFYPNTELEEGGKFDKKHAGRGTSVLEGQTRLMGTTPRTENWAKTGPGQKPKTQQGPQIMKLEKRQNLKENVRTSSHLTREKKA